MTKNFPGFDVELYEAYPGHKQIEIWCGYDSVVIIGGEGTDYKTLIDDLYRDLEDAIAGTCGDPYYDELFTMDELITFRDFMKENMESLIQEE